MFEPKSCGIDETYSYAEYGQTARGLSRFIHRRVYVGQSAVEETPPLHTMGEQRLAEQRSTARRQIRMILEGFPVNRPGASSDANRLLDAYEEAGWTCRLSSKNHWICRAPVGGQTEAVSRTIYGNQTRAYFSRLNQWKTDHMPSRLNQWQADHMSKEEPVQAKAEVTGQSLTEPATVVSEELFLLPSRKTRGWPPNMYQQTLSNGHIRYRCRECNYLSENPRSVAQHSAEHTREQAASARDRSAEPDAPSEPGPEPAEDMLAKVRELLKVVPTAEVAQLKAENDALRAELAAMRAEREALRDLLN